MPAPVAPDRRIRMEIVAGQSGVAGTTDGDGRTAALLDYPAGICADPNSGVIYFCDGAGSASASLRKYDPTTREVTTIVTGLEYPGYPAVGPASGHIYVPEYYLNHIREYAPDGTLVRTSGTSDATGHAMLPVSLVVDTAETHAAVYCVRRGEQDTSLWRLTCATGAVLEIVDEWDPSPAPFQAARSQVDGYNYFPRSDGPSGGNVWRSDVTGFRQETFRQYDNVPTFALTIDDADDMWIGTYDGRVSVSNLAAEADGVRHTVESTPIVSHNWAGFAFLNGYVYATDAAFLYNLVHPLEQQPGANHLIWRWNIKGVRSFVRGGQMPNGAVRGGQTWPTGVRGGQHPR